MNALLGLELGLGLVHERTVRVRVRARVSARVVGEL